MTQQRHKHAMNLAIDRLLDADERDALDAHLDQSPGDAQLWNRIQRVDRILRSAPLINAPSSFSARLMAAIAAGRQPHTDTRYGIGIAVGLLVVAFTAIPILGFVLFLAAHVAADTAALQMLLNQVVLFLNSLSALLNDLLKMAASFVAANPFAPLLAAVMLPMTALCGWLMWTLSGQRDELVTYRIPVRVLS